MSYDSAFSDRAVVRALCRLRIRLATKRHDVLFEHNIRPIPRPEPGSSELAGLFPPRRKWIRPSLKHRAGRSAPEINAIALEHTVIQGLARSSPAGGWQDNMRATILRIRQLGLDAGQLRKPRIIPLPKSKGVFRPIAVYQVEERVVTGLCARYLRQKFDKDFLPCSYAFRVHSLDRPTPQHHDAVEDLCHFRDSQRDKTLWVAEADIQAFFDSVDHSVAKRMLAVAIDRASRRGEPVDPRATATFNEYLSSYSFDGTAEPASRDYFLRRGITGVLKRPPGLSPAWSLDSSRTDVGVPQGGAISCLIANLLLDRADRAIVEDGNNDCSNMFFARYCDDMILIHTSESACRSKFGRYCEVLNDLSLHVHKPVDLDTYDKSWWSNKSRAPYRWGMPVKAGYAPWVGFVGYQIRYDGMVRIRPNSLHKELVKQVKVADRVLSAIRHRARSGPPEACNRFRADVRKSKEQVTFRLSRRLIAMSVGKDCDNPGGIDGGGFSWAAGFRVLKGRRFVESQVKTLDRSRERQLRRIGRALQGLKTESDSRLRALRWSRRSGGFSTSYYRAFFGSKHRDENNGNNRRAPGIPVLVAWVLLGVVAASVIILALYHCM